MLSKTIKLGFSLLIATIFLAGCASTSQPTDTDSSTTAGTTTSGTTTSSATGSTTTQSSDQQVADLGTVFYFEFDQSTLTAATRALLIAHAADLKTYPRNVRLEGHADERGTREYNMALGERRAMAVRDYLRSEGVTTPIEVVSYGEEQPVSSGGFEAAWSLDRRVEIK
ncbi:MAG: peptidoglycan-associated lipoprotein [Cellvibrionaceae bacterium]|jgi:peptidoglycan-associated lipoprotein